MATRRASDAEEEEDDIFATPSEHSQSNRNCDDGYESGASNNELVDSSISCPPSHSPCLDLSKLSISENSLSKIKDPCVVPKGARYYLHDDRTSPITNKPRKIWKKESDLIWKNDMFHKIINTEEKGKVFKPKSGTKRFKSKNSYNISNLNDKANTTDQYTAITNSFLENKKNGRYQKYKNINSNSTQFTNNEDNHTLSNNSKISQTSKSSKISRTSDSNSNNRSRNPFNKHIKNRNRQNKQNLESQQNRIPVLQNGIQFK